MNDDNYLQQIDARRLREWATAIEDLPSTLEDPLASTAPSESHTRDAATTKNAATDRESVSPRNHVERGPREGLRFDPFGPVTRSQSREPQPLAGSDQRTQATPRGAVLAHLGRLASFSLGSTAELAIETATTAESLGATS